MTEKFKTLFKNDSLEIIECRFKSRNGKWFKSWYVDFGCRGELYSKGCFIEFEKISELKQFIKMRGIETSFTKSFLTKQA